MKKLTIIDLPHGEGKTSIALTEFDKYSRSDYIKFILDGKRKPLPLGGGSSNTHILNLLYLLEWILKQLFSQMCTLGQKD